MNLICTFFCNNWLNVSILCVNIAMLVIMVVELKGVRQKLQNQINQEETERKSKMDSNKSHLTLLLQNLSTDMENAEPSKRGGNFNESIFEDQRKIELQIFSLIAELKARTTNKDLEKLLESIEKTVLSYGKIQSDYSEHADKATAFNQYKTELKETIQNLNNIKNEYKS